MDELFKEVYSDPRQPGSFGGAEKLKYGVEKVNGVEVKERDAQNWLSKKDTYTRFRSSRKNFKRNPIIVAHIDAQWQGDLADVSNLSRNNKGIRFLLVLIDVLSKFIWVEPLKTKNGEDVLAGFKRIFQRTTRRPLKLQTDDGTEFWYRGLQNFLKENNITFFTIKSDKKAAVAERVIRTLKEKIWRYNNENNTPEYINVLQDLVASYNDTYHKSIKRAPSEVNESNEGEILGILYGKIQKTKKKKPKFKVGDFVRLNNIKTVFKKGYTGNWTEEIFIIHAVKESARPFTMYKVKDWLLEVLEGSFYEKEMQLVSKDLDGYYIIDKKIRSRTVGKKKEWLIKWKGYPDSFNSWVRAEDIKDV
jgi:Integrase core domain/Chromo (CHRromatin Organisation MOdifier) domain